MSNRRSGLLARKIGMTRLFDEATGESISVTAMRILNCRVIGHMVATQEGGYNAVVLGINDSKVNHNKPMRGIFKKYGHGEFSFIKEFRVSENGFDEVGADLNVMHFKEVNFVDVSAVSKGKGFAGPMKRHNFKGLRATHGVSRAHRSHGSTGQREYPGRVFKGKKMAGHMGAARVTQQNLKVIDINSSENVIYIKGTVPGANSSVVEIKGAVKKTGVLKNEA